MIDILLFHVIPGAIIDRAAIQAGPIDAVTAQGQDIAIEGLLVGDATVLSFDTFGLNGVIHVIDAVLIPPPVPTIAEIGIASGNFDVVFDQLTAAGLGNALDVEGPISKSYQSIFCFVSIEDTVLKTTENTFLSHKTAFLLPLRSCFWSY